MDLNLQEIINLDIIDYNNIKRLNLKINNILIDSRLNEKKYINSLFVALKGEKFDGHKFIKQVKDYRIAAVICSEKPNYKIPYILVKDTTEFLGQIARIYLKKFKVKIIGITGTCGKTTTKEIISGILKSKYKVLSSPKSFNNNIGIPLTIFSLKKNHEILVLEYGTNHLGEIKYLVSVAKPDIAVVTTITPVHLEGLKNIKNIIKAKKELIDGLTKNDTVIINSEITEVKEVVKEFKGKVIDIKNIKQKIKSPFLGNHNILNFNLSLEVCKILKLKNEEIKNGIKKIKKPEFRLEIKKIKNYKFIVDCYNANPASMKAAIDFTDELKVKGRRICVLGDMLELGNQTNKYHKELGKHLLESKFDIFLLIGDNIKITYKILKNKNVFLFKNNIEIINFLKQNLKTDDTILLKASRKFYLENIIKKLEEIIIK